MKKLMRACAAAVAVISLALSGTAIAAAAPAPASVAVVAAVKSAPVVIRTIPNKTVTGSAKAKITPLVSATKAAKVTSKRLTVKQGKKAVASNVASASLKAGTYSVTTTVKYKLGKAAKSATKTQKLVVTKKASVRSTAISGKNCPKGYPVKGNRTGSNKEWKYHVPGGRFYNITTPEECFKTEAAARAAGYRKSKL
ncbi:hypothetical protein AAIH25_19890 [Arthrobacter crystallopoietes]|uniref:sunset domain-containing protein n=1 Tax=Micrococcaceae TaxID=1268 RepID=UPI0021C81763|nr:hypothetical protein [Arthrobacter sp. Marseille-P9274]